MLKSKSAACVVFIVVLQFSAAPAFGGEQNDPPPAPERSAVKLSNAEARKRQFEMLQKELEPLRPADGAAAEEVLTYLEMAMESYGKFARENPKTPEGFEAASLVAILLSRANHPKAKEFADLAVKTAPAAGVDSKRLALCWALVADGKLREKDIAGARAALENIKKLDKDIYQQLSTQLNASLKQSGQPEEGERKPGGEQKE